MGKLNRKKWQKVFQNDSIQKKIVLIFILIILILSISGSAVVIVYLNTSYKNQLLNSAYNELKQVDNAISKKTENYYYASYAVQNNADMKKVLEGGSEKSIEAQYQDMWVMNSVLETAMLPFFMEQISVYVDDRAVYAGNNMAFLKRSTLEKYDEYRSLEASAKPYIWLPKEELFDSISKREEYISFLRKIGSNNSPAGYMRVNIKTEELQQELEKSINMDGEFAFLYGGEDKEIISSTDMEAAESICKQVISEMGNSAASNKWIKIRGQDGKKYYIYTEGIASTDWISVSAVPASKLLQGIRKMIFLWLTSVVLVGMLALYLASRLAGSITNRLHLLEENMGYLSEGRFEKMAEEDSKDEIANLIRHYNQAINQLITLYQNRYDSMKKLKSAQLKVLQSQINPHFLYNTLDLIHWEALEANATRVSDITQALARFYRLSLNDGREIVSIRDEMNHVISYLELMNYKYKQSIRYQAEIPDMLYRYSIAKITLQPLVENAILHGLAEREKMSGSEIEIYGWEENGFIFLQIQDNGAGMDAEKLNLILEGIEPPVYDIKSSGHGFGIRNIHERLQLLFGEECGLHYESMAGESTSVTVKLAAVLAPDSE